MRGVRLLLAAQAWESGPRKEDSLSAIADLKVGQIDRWREEHLANAAAITANEAIAETAARFLRDDGAHDRAVIVSWLDGLHRSYDCRSATLLDASCQPRLFRGDEDKRLGARTQEALRRGGGIAAALAFRSAPRRRGDGNPSGSDRAAPAAAGRRRRRLWRWSCCGSDPYRSLYPMLRRWPTPSRSGEAMLCRREDGDVLFLNELRYQSNTALRCASP